MVCTFAKKQDVQAPVFLFGKDACRTILVGDDGLVALDSNGLPHRITPNDPLFRSDALFLRFINRQVFAETLERYPALFDRCCAAILAYAGCENRDADTARLRSHGLATTTATPTGPVVVFRRRLNKSSDVGDATYQDFQRLVVVDPCLDGSRGHYLPLAQNISAGAIDIGMDVTWACNVNASEEVRAQEGIDICPTFHYSYFDFIKDKSIGVLIAITLARDLAGLLGRFDRPYVKLLLHSADPFLIRALASRLQDGRQLQCAIHLCLPNYPWKMVGRTEGLEVSRALMTIRESRSASRVFFWAETEALAREMSARIGASVPVLKPPAPNWPGPTSGKRDRVRLAYLGEARREKGFFDLPDLAEAIAANQALASRVELFIQYAEPFCGFDEEHLAARHKLEGFSFVTFADGLVDYAQYQSYLANSDVVLLPYEQRVYSSRGSGIFIDAVSAGAVVLAKAHIAALDAEQDGVVFNYDTRAGFVEALEQIVARLEFLSDRARERAQIYKRKAGASRYVGALQDRVNFSADPSQGTAIAPAAALAS